MADIDNKALIEAIAKYDLFMSHILQIGQSYKNVVQKHHIFFFDMPHNIDKDENLG